MRDMHQQVWEWKPAKSNIKWGRSEKTLLHLKDENSQMFYEQRE